MEDNIFTISCQARNDITYANYQAENYTKQLTSSAKQNSFSFLKEVSIINHGKEDLANARLSFAFSCPFIKGQPVFLSFLEAEKETTIDSFSFSLDAESLYKLNEAFPVDLTLSLIDKDEKTLASALIHFKALPIGESASEDMIPEILSSFVTPNDDEVKKVCRIGEDILLAKYSQKGFAGYQYNNPDKVMEQADALYCALAQCRISYANPPASFQKIFQRVRLPREVLLEKRGTCLDLAILYCSVLESVGLKPVLILLSGHALAGCFLEDASLASTLEENGSQVLKLSARGYDSLALVETTGFVKNPAMDFPTALLSGKKDLSGDMAFDKAIDISNCRSEMILPLPTPHVLNGQTVINYALASNIRYTLEHISKEDKGFINPKAPVKKDKFDYWEEKLLDLGLRNRLINFRIGKNTLQAVNGGSQAFLAKLASESLRFCLKAYPQKITEDKISKDGVIDFNSPLFKDAFDKSLSKNELLIASSSQGQEEDSIKALARKGKMILEESGSNAMLLTIGLIRFYPTDRAGEIKTGSMLAPLLLLPIHIPSKKVGFNYYLDPDEDQIALNTTAFEYFRQNFSLDFSALSGTLPTKYDGSLDLQKIFNTVREIISVKKSWELIDNASFLSTFSFSHFVMWNDIHSKRDILLKSKIVSSFEEGHKTYKEPEEDMRAADLDEKIAPSNLAIPLSADSSQVKAIYDSTIDKSFILDGPPGTGKSQTIANMIVNALYLGKKILFVAEKEVALQVVKSRLDRLGLGSFCLLIHSNRAVKSNVLDDLGSALEKGHIKSPQEYSQTAKKLEEKRKKLDGLVKALHDKKDFFVSIYEAINRYLPYKEFNGTIPVSEEMAEKMTASSYQQIKDAISKVSLYSKQAGGYFNSPLQPFLMRSYDLERREKLFLALYDLQKKVEILVPSGQQVLSSFTNLQATGNNFGLLFCVLTLLNDPNGIIFPGLDSKKTELKESELSLFFSQKEEEKTIQARLAAVFRDGYKALPAQDLFKKNELANQSSFIKRHFLTRGILKSLNKFALDKKGVSKANKDALLNDLYRLDNLQSVLNDSDSFLKEYSSSLSLSTLKSCSAAKQAFNNTQSLIKFSYLFNTKTPADNTAFLSKLKTLAQKDSEFFLKEPFRSFYKAYKEVKETNEKLRSEYSYNLFSYPDQDDYLSLLSKQLALSFKKKESLSIWVSLLNNLDYLSSSGLTSLVSSFKEGQLSEDNLSKAFDANLFYKIIVLSLKKENLTGLDSAAIDKDILAYKDEAEEFDRLTVQETAARVTSSYPFPNVEFSSSSPYYALNKLIKNHGRANTLRNIFTNYKDIILSICPCLLMSPLSAAQYLELGGRPFDLVIFDEASQIPTSEAIGALARGKNAIIAGDQEQMPPTDFFTANINSSDDEDAYKYEDMDSLLDDAIALNMSRESLLWHYRSHHESLISFSNNRFYDNRLLTFPSPSNQISQVKFRYVNGTYLKNRGINKEEAEAVVNEVMKRVQDPLQNRFSLGIVTFNIRQQTLIDDLLTKQEALHPELDFCPGKEEIFIKNLENVQGDERDVILFSTCYGKDKTTGALNLNFGPLSREKGERRLNVAVSRSKEEMVVFTSMQPEEIAYQKAKNNGAQFLYSFLLYAKNGVRTLSNSLTSYKEETNQGLSRFLKKDLENAGLKADCDIGSSSFRIDVAIKSNKNPARYVLGILLDDKTYSSSPTADDRNIIQPGILRSLGWKLIRIWSAEYLDRPNYVLEEIKKAYAQAEGEDNIVPPTGTDKEVNTPESSKPNELKELYQKESFQKMGEDEFASYPNNRKFTSFKYIVNDVLGFDALTNSQLANYINSVVNKEAPVSLPQLNKRIRTSFHCGRVGQAMQARINRAINTSGVYVNSSHGSSFLWVSLAQEKAYAIYRALENTRPIDEISLEEISNAMKDILLVQARLNKEDLMKAASSLFGSQAMKASARSYLSYACAYGVYAGKFSVKEENGTAFYSL